MSSLCASPEQACMLLGGKQDDSIGTYLFKPIQRVCKYPLLFRVSALHAQPLLSTGCTTLLLSLSLRNWRSTLHRIIQTVPLLLKPSQ